MCPPNTSLFITAGPGSGKTTVLTLKVLKFIFVDDIQPDQIVTTTFTRKAAKELRSRILGWGDQLKDHFQRSDLPQESKDSINNLNFNLIAVGTLDSIAEEKLREHRQPGTSPPALVSDYTSTSIMISKVLLKESRYRDSGLHDCIAELIKDKRGLTTRKKALILKEVRERFFTRLH